MNLTMICAGKFISVHLISELVKAAQGNTTISIDNAQGRPQAELVPVIQSAGNKKIAIHVDAKMASFNQTIALFTATSNPNASYSLTNANVFSLQQVRDVFSAMGNRPFSAHFDASAGSQEQAVNFISSAQGSNTLLTVSSLSSMTSAGISSVLEQAGSKNFTAQVPGDRASVTQILDILNKTTGINTTIILGNAQAQSATSLPQIFSTAGNKKFRPDFDGSKISASLLKQMISSAGQNTVVNVNTAQALSTSDLQGVISTAGTKRLDLNLNGAQFNSGQLVATVKAATSNTFLTVNTAHATNLHDMLEAITASGKTNLTLEYNGAQLVVTPVDGNYVVRAIEVARPDTSIVVNSLGTIQFNLDIVLDIIRAAG